MLEARCHPFALAPVALRAAPLLFALLALRDKVHLFAERLGDPLGDDALIEAPNQLLDGLALSAVYMHSDWPSVQQGHQRGSPLTLAPLTPIQPRSVPAALRRYPAEALYAMEPGGAMGVGSWGLGVGALSTDSGNGLNGLVHRGFGEWIERMRAPRIRGTDWCAAGLCAALMLGHA